MTPASDTTLIVVYAYNEAQMREPYESTLWDRWRQLLPVVHDQAEKAPGYLGRYHGEDDPLGYIAPRWPEDPLIMGNLSAWRTLRDLELMAFHGTHGKLLAHRHVWFEDWPHDRPHFVAWYGHAILHPDDKITPLFDLDTAMLMQSQLGQHGPDANVFGWRR